MFTLISNGIRSIFLQSLVIPEKFQHILRIMGTNIDGKRKVVIAMTAIKGVGRRYANIVLKKADVDLTKRAGECTDEEVYAAPIWMHPKWKKNCALVANKIVYYYTGREIGHNHLEPASIQDPKLVLEQTKGHHWWQVHAIDVV